MAEDDALIEQVRRLAEELDRRAERHRRLERFVEGNCPLPEAIQAARLTKLYRRLMPQAEAPWGSLVVDSKLDRLEVTGLRDDDEAAAQRVWDEAWQPNAMDSESKLAHGAALLDGRAFATVWTNELEEPDIALDDATQMVVEFAEGSRKRRTAALRRWIDGTRTYATLYRPEGIYKFQGPPESTTMVTEWERRRVEGEDWPLENPLEVVPVVEIPVNRRLKGGTFPPARGEFEHCVGLIERIHLLTFLGLVVAVDMGFPIRGVTGQKIQRRILRDDDDNPILDEATGKEKSEAVPPFENIPASVAQMESPDARTFEFKAADRQNLSVYAELDQLAVITKTPRHYFPMEGGMSNLSAEAIMASEGSMHAAVTGHKATLGEGWEEVLRLCGTILEVSISQRAEIRWADHESRSLAERADAFVKLAGSGLPVFAVAEMALGSSSSEIARWQADAATDPLGKLIAAAQEPLPPAGEPVPTAAPVGSET